MPGMFVVDDRGAKDHRAALPTAEEVLSAALQPVAVEGVRKRIRDFRAANGRRTAFLDDDPTDSSPVHDVEMAIVLELQEYEAALAA